MKLERQPSYLILEVNQKLRKVCNEYSLAHIELTSKHEPEFNRWISSCNKAVEPDRLVNLSVRVKLFDSRRNIIYYEKGQGFAQDKTKRPMFVSVGVVYLCFVRSFYLEYPISTGTETAL